MYDFVPTERGWLVFWGPDPRPAKEPDGAKAPDRPGNASSAPREGSQAVAGEGRA